MMMILLVLAIFGGAGRRVQSGIGSRARNLVQGIGDGTDQIFHTVTGNSGNGVEFKIALLAKIAKSFEPRAIGRGVQLGGDGDHRFFGEGRAKGFEFAVDDFERVDWIIGVGVARVNQMDEQARAFDVAEETDAEACA